MSKKNNYQDIIAALDQANESNTIDIFVPSKQETVKFKPLTVNHQKKIIETAIDAADFNISAQSLLSSEIINDCCVGSTDDFYVTDRDAILIGLRVQTLGYDVPTQTDQGEQVKVNIKQHVNNFTTTPPPSGLFDTQTIECDGVSLEVRVPRLVEDDEVNKKILPRLSKTLKDDEDLKSVVGESLLYEFIKYIVTLRVGNQTIEFDNSQATQLIKVLEALPMSVSNLIVKEMEKVKQYEHNFTRIKQDNQTLTIVTDARFYHSE